jgi:DNA replication protein
MNKGYASIPHLLLENYNKLSLSDAEMMLIIHIYSFANEGVYFPSIQQLQERMSCTTGELSSMLNRLHKEKFLDIQPSMDREGMMDERYSIEPLWEKLAMYLSISLQPKEEAAVSQDVFASWPNEGNEELSKLEGEIFRRFEQEFGRPLSPIECETIGLWLDEDLYEPHLIFLALKEAVISSKLSLRYIDRILFEWQKNGLKTPDEVREYSKKFRQQQTSKLKPKDQGEPVQFPFYNWLEK